MLEFAKPLPQYQCHKIVGALKIKSITPEQKARWITLYKIEFEEEGYDPITMPQEWYNKHKPCIGGYFVQYKDGYVSYSPAKEFIDGYTKVER